MEIRNIYEIIKNSLPVGFYLVDREGIIIDFNTAAEVITGYRRDEVIGKSHLKLFHGTDDENACPLFKHTLLKKEHIIATEAVIRKKGGEFITISATIAPLFEENEDFIGGIELFRDITERKRLERERKNILSMFAHDMKNPLISVIGLILRLQTGKAGSLTGDQKIYIDTIAVELEKLQQLTSDFLDFSRYEDMGFKPVFEPFNIEEALHRQVDSFKIGAEKKAIKLRIETPEKPVSHVNADPILINRVITNLLDNAIKYSDMGGTVIVRVIDSDSEVTIQIEDTGSGISTDHLPYIFDAFYRGKRDTTGSGLGLSIVKKIIEAHNGRIWVESIINRGSTFSFTLPKR